MREDILDYIEPNDKKGKSKLLKLVPFLILVPGVILSSISGLLVNVQILLGLIGVVLTAIVLIVNFRKGILFNGILLFLGCFNIINFYPYELAIGINFDGMKIGIDFILIGLTSFFLNLNMEEFKPQFQNLIYGNTQTRLENEKTKKNAFKNRFQDRSLQELEVIAENKMLVEEARNAAKELIEEKTNGRKETT